MCEVNKPHHEAHHRDVAVLSITQMAIKSIPFHGRTSAKSTVPSVMRGLTSQINLISRSKVVRMS